MTVLTTDRWFIYVSGFWLSLLISRSCAQVETLPDIDPLYIVGWGGVYLLPIASVDSARLQGSPFCGVQKSLIYTMT